MRQALNASFEEDRPEIETAIPPGRELAAGLAAALTSAGLSTGAVTAWRDTGWIVTCEADDWDVEVLLVGTSLGRWNLQIAHGRLGGLFSRQGGTLAEHGASECYTTARALSEWLRSRGRFRDFHWRCHEIGLGIGNAQSFVQIKHADGDPPVHITVGDPEADDFVAFYFMGEHHTEIPRRNLAPSAVARRILTTFALSGSRPSDVTWEEI